MKILFLCEDNRASSVLAATYFQHLCKQNKLDDEVQVASAGIQTKEELSTPQEIIDILGGLGITFEAQTARQLNAELIEESDSIVVMNNTDLDFIKKNFADAASKTRLILSLLGSEDELDAPHEGDIETFEQCFLNMMPALAELLDRIKRSRQ